MPSKINEEPIFIGLSTKSEFLADLDEEPLITGRFGPFWFWRPKDGIELNY